MTLKHIIELDEQDVQAAIKQYVKNRIEDDFSIEKIKMFTGVRGDYDKGSAEEYVRSVRVSLRKL